MERTKLASGSSSSNTEVMDESTVLFMLGLASAFVLGTLMLGVLVLSMNNAARSRAFTYAPIITVMSFIFSIAYALAFQRLSLIIGGPLAILFVFTFWRKDTMKALSVAPIAVMIFTVICQVLLKVQFS